LQPLLDDPAGFIAGEATRPRCTSPPFSSSS
jgi:hypothetical protein